MRTKVLKELTEIWVARDCMRCGGMSGCIDCSEVTKHLHNVDIFKKMDIKYEYQST